MVRRIVQKGRPAGRLLPFWLITPESRRHNLNGAARIAVFKLWLAVSIQLYEDRLLLILRYPTDLDISVLCVYVPSPDKHRLCTVNLRKVKPGWI